MCWLIWGQMLIWVRLRAPVNQDTYNFPRGAFLSITAIKFDDLSRKNHIYFFIIFLESVQRIPNWYNSSSCRFYVLDVTGANVSSPESLHVACCVLDQDCYERMRHIVVTIKKCYITDSTTIILREVCAFVRSQDKRKRKKLLSSLQKNIYVYTKTC